MQSIANVVLAEVTKNHSRRLINPVLSFKKTFKKKAKNKKDKGKNVGKADHFIPLKIIKQ